MTASESTDEDDRIPLGATVVDRDDTDSNKAVVVRHHEAEAAEVKVVDTGKTVAEFNPDYPATAPVATVVFESELDDAVDGWRQSLPDELWKRVQAADLRHYSYPEPRLDVVGQAVGEQVQIWFDGACEPSNPGGHGTYGVVVEIGDDTVHEEAGYIGEGNGVTNNVAEYKGLITPLEYVAEEYPERHVEVRGDSQLIIRQLTGQYDVNSERLRPLWRQARGIANELSVEFQWVPREHNQRADALATKAYEENALAEAIKDRRKRAHEEDMNIEQLGENIYEVKGDYQVDLAERSCTCPDYQHRGHACKHLLAVEMATDPPEPD